MRCLLWLAESGTLHFTLGGVQVLRQIRSVAVGWTGVYWLSLSWSRCWGRPWHTSGLRSRCCPVQHTQALHKEKMTGTFKMLLRFHSLWLEGEKKTLWTWTHLGQPACMTVVFFFVVSRILETEKPGVLKSCPSSNTTSMVYNFFLKHCPFVLIRYSILQFSNCDGLKVRSVTFFFF